MPDATPPRDLDSEGYTPPKRRKLGLGWWLAIFTVVLLASVAALLTAWSISGSRRAEAELALIRAAGEPLTPADLEALYTYPPPEEDTTALWLEGLNDLRKNTDRERWQALPFVGLGKESGIPLVGQTWELLPAAEACLAHNARSLELFHEAARRRGVARYPVRIDNFGDLTFDVTEFFAAGRILQLEAVVRACRHDSAGAASSVDTLLELSRSLERCPTRFAQRFRFVCDPETRRSLASVMARVSLSDADLRAIRASIQRPRYEDDAHLACLVGRIALLRILDKARFYESIDEELPPMHFFNQADDKACLLSYSRRMLETTRLAWPDGHRERRLISDEFESEVSSAWLGRVRHPFSTLFDPTLTPEFYSAIQATAAMRSADAALAAEQYRRQNGEFPKSLEVLVPEYLPAVPHDPFDGNPLRYIVRDAECVVYSIGMNEKDDGGRENEFTTAPDITFTVRKSGTSTKSASEQAGVPASAGSGDPNDAPPEGGTPTKQD